MNDEARTPERMDAPQRTNAIEQYVDRACGHLGLKSTLKEHIRDEIRGHLLEAIEAHVAGGMPRENAVARALEEFGNPGDVAEGLKAVYGRHAVCLLIEKAMEWKERTMKSGWKWSFVAHFMLGALILAEILLILGAATYIFPVIVMEHKQLGLLLPPYFLTTLAVVRTVDHWLWLLVAMAVVAIGAFEWRYKGENKPVARLALGGGVAVVLMGLVWGVGFASTVPLIQLRGQMDYSRTAVVIQRSAIEADAAYREILRAFAAEQPQEASAAAHRLGSAMRDIEWAWAGPRGLAALEPQDERSPLQDLAREVESRARDMSLPEWSTLSAEERKIGHERLKSAYERLGSVVEWWPKP